MNILLSNKNREPVHKKEIGGYFSLETNQKPRQFPGIALNSGRNALRYILRKYPIKRIFVPYYTCPVVWKVVREENIQIVFYHIDEYLEIREQSSINFSHDDYILVNNYFGIKTEYIKKLSEKYKNLIVDDAQSFYAPPLALAHFNSPRKFFGLPDGGFALCNENAQSQEVAINSKPDYSYDRCSHLFMRTDKNADFAYHEFKKNEEKIDSAPFALMSKLTSSLMQHIDYNNIQKIRKENFAYLDSKLKHKNELHINKTNIDIPMVYPFMINDKALRAKLIENKIFVATYWPEIEYECKHGFELYLKKFLLPLPIDQRYSIDDMEAILEVLDV